jgi:glycosyltransferase involved in cell wall biosynthesis
MDNHKAHHNRDIIDYIKQKELPFYTIDRHGLKHDEVLELMGKALVYIGNSISDGMSNTLLEAIVMGAFPIQSNPGKVSEEIINNNINGLIINNPESTLEIKNLILEALKDKKRVIEAEKINSDIAISRLDFIKNRDKVIAIYNSIFQ